MTSDSFGPTEVTHWLVPLAGNQLWLAVLLFKLFAGLVHLINTLLIGLTASRLYHYLASPALLQADKISL